METATDAFIERFTVAPTGSGTLDGLRLAVKDLIDVAGHRTGCGNPRWRETHPPAVAHAVAVELLLAAGARLVGKTISDELAFSIIGENAHYGTPRNPAAPDRIPGGSSSGSASAVAGGECDVGLGTDTTGSVRVPAASCGVFGMRPTHDRVSLAGVMPFAPSFDTVGAMARDLPTLARAMRVLAGLEDRPAGPSPRVALVREAWTLAEPGVLDAGRAWLATHGVHAEEVGLADLVGSEGRNPATWLATHCQLQWAEIAASLGSWVASARPQFGDLIAANFRLLDQVDRARLGERVALRERLAARLGGALADGRLLCIPTTSAPPPRKGHPFGDRTDDAYMTPTLTLQTFASIGRLPQVTVPAGMVDGAPVGVSFLAGAGEDARLLAWLAGVVR
ncbi:MAG: amidase [bacterium]|nr:amidase [bacterium]